MTKVEAIKKVIEENGGEANLETIYNQIEKYYPEAKKSREWQAGIRGVIYRDVGKTFARGTKVATFRLFRTVRKLEVKHECGQVYDELGELDRTAADYADAPAGAKE